MVAAGLTKRFEKFITTQNGFESIDALLNTVKSEAKRADYFLKDRAIIIEQKALEMDPGYKVQNFADELLAQGNVAVYGKRPIQDVRQTSERQTTSRATL